MLQIRKVASTNLETLDKKGFTSCMFVQTYDRGKICLKYFFKYNSPLFPYLQVEETMEEQFPHEESLYLD